MSDATRGYSASPRPRGIPSTRAQSSTRGDGGGASSRRVVYSSVLGLAASVWPRVVDFRSFYVIRVLVAYSMATGLADTLVPLVVIKWVGF